MDFCTCTKCHRQQNPAFFAPTRSPFFPTGHLPICNSCIEAMIAAVPPNDKWEYLNSLCRWADYPFIPREWERLAALNTNSPVWPVYARIFSAREYEGFGWSYYNTQFEALRAASLIETELPLLDDAHYADLRRTWGPNYSPEELDYLEDLYAGLKSSQNIVGALQVDQAQKICKLSLEIDSRIRDGDKDIEKFLISYDRLIKTAEFTPKNTKNAADFESTGELLLWLEKRGFQNHFYDGATRDVIDETLKTMQSYNQRLYINEGGIGEAITDRLNALKAAAENADPYSYTYSPTDPTPDDPDSTDDTPFNLSPGADNEYI